MRLTHPRAVGLLIVTAALWSTSGLAVKMLTWPPLAILGGRSLFACVFVLAYLRSFPRRLTRWQVTAALANLGAQFLFISATKLTTSANAIFLQYTAPIYVVGLAAWLLRERPRRADGVAMLAIFAGLLLFFGDQLDFSGWVGNGLAILSGVALALMMVGMRPQRGREPVETLLVSNLLGMGLGLPAAFQQHWIPQDVLIIVLLGLFQIGLASILYALAMPWVPALEATLLLTLEPVLNPIWVFLVLHEQPGGWALGGAGLVVAAVLGRAWASARPSAATASPPAVPLDSARN